MSLFDTLIQEHFQPPAQMNRKTTRANSSLIQPKILEQSCTVRPTTTNQYEALNRLSPALNPNGIASSSPAVAESDEATLGSSPKNPPQPCKRLNHHLVSPWKATSSINKTVWNSTAALVSSSDGTAAASDQHETWETVQNNDTQHSG